jgi:hypothetical protein
MGEWLAEEGDYVRNVTVSVSKFPRQILIFGFGNEKLEFSGIAEIIIYSLFLITFTCF